MSLIATLRENWSIIAGFTSAITLAVSIYATGAVAMEKIHNLEQAQIRQVEQQEKLADMKAKQERIDERTERLLDATEKNQQLLQQLLLRVQ